MSNCRKCKRELLGDEIALHKRLISRGEETYLCLTCLAEFFGTTEELLNKKIVHFRNTGCLLFAKAKNKSSE